MIFKNFYHASFVISLYQFYIAITFYLIYFYVTILIFSNSTG